MTQPSSNYPAFPGENNYGAKSSGSTSPMTQGTGKAKAIESLGWGFKTTFRSPGAWLGFTFVAGTLLILILGALAAYIYWPVMKWSFDNPEADPSTIPADIQTPSSLLFIIPAAFCVAVLTPLFISCALKATDGRKVSFGDFFRPKNVLWSFLSYFVFYLIYFWVSDISPQPVQEEPSSLDMISIIAPLVLVFVMPLLMLIPFVWQDTGCDFAQGFSTGLQASARNYLSLLGFSLLMALISIVAVIPLGLGLLVVMPAQVLGTAYLYRQATAGPLPVAS